MKPSNALTGLLVACGLTSTAQAVTLESGVVYGGPAQTHVACVVMNWGTTPVTFSSKLLYGQFRGNLAPTYDDCGSTLGAKTICSFQVPTPSQEAASCKISVSETNANIRGTMMSLTDPLDKPLSQSDLR